MELSGPGLSFVGRFFILIESFYLLLVYSDFLLLYDSFLETCMLLGIYTFLLGYLLC